MMRIFQVDTNHYFDIDRISIIESKIMDILLELIALFFGGRIYKKAKKWIEGLTKEVQPGEVYDGVVKRIMAFGAFVEILPGKEGLVHISQLAPYRVEDIKKEVELGQKFKVKVVEVDSQGRINLTRKNVE